MCPHYHIMAESSRDFADESFSHSDILIESDTETETETDSSHSENIKGVHGQTTDESHTDDIRVHTSDMRMTYEYMLFWVIYQN